MPTGRAFIWRSIKHLTENGFHVFKCLVQSKFWSNQSIFTWLGKSVSLRRKMLYLLPWLGTNIFNSYSPPAQACIISTQISLFCLYLTEQNFIIRIQICSVVRHRANISPYYVLFSHSLTSWNAAILYS